MTTAGSEDPTPGGVGDPRDLPIWHPLRHSLLTRVVAITLGLALLAILAVGVYLSQTVAGGLFEQRRDRILDEAADVSASFVGVMNSSEDRTRTQQQDAATEFVLSLRTDNETSERHAALIPAAGTGLTVVSTDRAVVELVSDELRQQVREGEGLFYQSVSWETADGQVPAMVVGTRVDLRGSGPGELYLLYSLENEQHTLTFVNRAMIGGGVVLMVLITGIAFVVGRSIVGPLEQAATAAELIAHGDLGARVPVRGQDEIASLGRSFNDMSETVQAHVEELEELSRLQRRFVSDVSHELRTPLTTIAMGASVVEAHKDEFDPEVERSVELMTEQIDRFEVLLSDLLEISRFDAGGAELEAGPVDLNTVVETVASGLAALADTRESELDVQVFPGNAWAAVDRRRIERILRNLISNALEHGGGAPVRITVGADDEAVAVVVQDRGNGLSPEQAEHVFDRFWRGDPSRARTVGGTGLGLAISLEDAHLHDGWLQAWGQEGEGAVFRLTLPRRPGSTLRRSPLSLERPLDAAGPAPPEPPEDEQGPHPQDLPEFDRGGPAESEQCPDDTDETGRSPT